MTLYLCTEMVTISSIFHLEFPIREAKKPQQNSKKSTIRGWCEQTLRLVNMVELRL